MCKTAAGTTDVTVTDHRAAAFVLVHAIEGIIEAVAERTTEERDPLAVVMQASRMVMVFLDSPPSR